MPMIDDRRERPDVAGDEQPPRRRRAEAHRERALAGDRVGRDVAHVVGEEDRAREQPHDERAPPRGRRHLLHLHVRGADRGDEPEEHEHHDLAEAEVAVRLRSAGVEPRRRRWRRRRRAAATGSPRARARGPRPRPRRTRGRPRASPHRRRQSGRGEPHRTLAVLVGAAHAVGVVVRVVDADLQRERDDERGPRTRHQITPSASATAAAVPTSTGATAAPNVRGRAPCTHSDGRRSSLPTSTNMRRRERAICGHFDAGRWERRQSSRVAWGTGRSRACASRGRRCLPSCASSPM